MNEAAQRARVVDAAKSWLRTPYHNRVKIKHVGVDCLTLIIAAYEEAGIVTNIDIPKYKHDFMLHQSDELYLNGIMAHSRQVEHPLPGDIGLWRFGRCYSHGAIVIEWPIIIHAKLGDGCILEDAEKSSWLHTTGDRPAKPRPRKFFSYWS